MSDKTVAELMALADNFALDRETVEVMRLRGQPGGDMPLRQQPSRAALEQAIRRAVDWGEPHAWLTTGTIDGKRRLSMGAVTTNPEYKKMHKEWEWTPLYAKRKDQ